MNDILLMKEGDNMIKLRTIKNSFSNIKSKYMHTITEKDGLERYMIHLIDEVESVPENERIYYTDEEFWKMVEEREIERYGHRI